MASERQILANRRNAKKSTGPITALGKKRSSKNAYNHGLSLPIRNVGSQKQLQELSRLYAGDASDPKILALAERAADAQADLTRVRNVKTAMLERALMQTQEGNRARLVHRWVKSIGLDSASYGTHSMRRTKAAQIYRKTGNLRAVQLLLGHTKLESTVRYLGIETKYGRANRSLILHHRLPPVVASRQKQKDMAKTEVLSVAVSTLERLAKGDHASPVSNRDDETEFGRVILEGEVGLTSDDTFSCQHRASPAPEKSNSQRVVRKDLTEKRAGAVLNLG